MLYSKYKGHPCVTEALLFTCYCRKKTPKTDILTVSPPLFCVLRGPAQPWLNRWSGSSRGAGLRRQVNGALACVSAIKTWETVSVQTWTIQYAVIQNTMKFTVNLIISAECWTFTISCHVICPVSWSVPCVCVCVCVQAALPCAASLCLPVRWPVQWAPVPASLCWTASGACRRPLSPWERPSGNDTASR